MPDLFPNIKVGDTVVEHVGYTESAPVAHIVTRVTAKQFEASGIQWRKDNGRFAKSARYSNARRVQPMTPELQLLLEKTKAKLLAMQLEPKLRTLSLEQLRQVEAVVEGAD